MLDAIRQLTRTLKLKELIIANFIPEETGAMLERRAVWVENEEGDGWVIPVRIVLSCLLCLLWVVVVVVLVDGVIVFVLEVLV